MQLAAPEDHVGGFEEKLEPAGAPVSERVTGAVKPLVELRATLNVADDPTVTVCVDGLRASVNVGLVAGVIVNETVVLTVTPPPVASTTIVRWPVGSPAGSTSAPDADPLDQVAGSGEKFEPVGALMALSSTGAVKPSDSLRVRGRLCTDPALTVDVVVMCNEKVGTAGSVLMESWETAWAHVKYPVVGGLQDETKSAAIAVFAGLAATPMESTGVSPPQYELEYWVKMRSRCSQHPETVADVHAGLGVFVVLPPQPSSYIHR